ncbi:MAG: dihydropteroate synthase [Deltaproteobacteria bacterium]|nr:dihydropteroate synthase [Deltaproteobacteria bacterium]
MLIVGEKINGTRKRVGEAVTNRDEDFIKKLAVEQANAGAGFIDVNAGTSPDREPEDLVWLVRMVQQVVVVPLCLDSSSPKALSAGFSEVKQMPMVNSISAEPQRLEDLLPLVSVNACKVIALAIDENGMPKGLDDRMTAVRKVLKATQESGVLDDNVYVDPLLLSIATDTNSGEMILDTIRTIRSEYPHVHIISGLSNISFGLPKRSLINRTFLTLAMAAGMDCAIADPTDQELRETLLATDLLLARDRFCRGYTGAYRSGLISAAS